MNISPGMHLGRWTVIGGAPPLQGKGRVNKAWHCRCDCGTERVVADKNLKNGSSKSCGCLQKEAAAAGCKAATKEKNKINLVGKKFGRLTVIKQVGDVIGSNSKWQCECDCGNYTVVLQNSITSGATTSCGCYNREVSAKNFENEEIRRKAGLIAGTRISSLRQKRRVNNTSGVVGVTYQKKTGKWLAYIWLQKTYYFLGLYADKADAAKARKLGEDRIHGEFLEWYAETYPEEWARIQRKKGH